MPAQLMACAALAALFFQVSARPPARLTTAANPGDSYGPPQPAELWDLTSGVFDRRPVIIKGELGQLERKDGMTYNDLREKGGHAVIVMVPVLVESADRLLGRRVEVVGLVRALQERQGTCQMSLQTYPQSYCDDPGLPPTPDLTSDRMGWPRVSITIWSIEDVTPLERRTPSESGSLDGPPGTRVTLLGQFAGANLGGELPSKAPEPGAWVLKTGEAAIWVVGKEPKGKGWSFDPAYRGDVGKWLEVQGRLATCGTLPCLRANRLTLTARPAGEEQ
jgi:hypothetical protein